MTIEQRIAWLEDRRAHYAVKEEAASTQSERDLWAHWRRNADRVLAKLSLERAAEAA